MSDYKCPHCHNSVPHGATVCRGCQAEVHYGPSGKLLGAVVVCPVLLGMFLFQDWGLILGILIGTGLGVVLKKALKDRVYFYRERK